MYLSVGSWLCAVMCPSGIGVVVGSYVPFWKGVGGRQLCDLLEGWLSAIMCLSVWWLVVGSYVPFRKVAGCRQLCALLVGCWWCNYLRFRYWIGGR
jgi:hypothetical protein